MTHKSIVIHWNGQRAIQNLRELTCDISVEQLRLRLWSKKYFLECYVTVSLASADWAKVRFFPPKNFNISLITNGKERTPNMLERYLPSKKTSLYEKWHLFEWKYDKKWVYWVSLEKTLPPPNGSKSEIPLPKKSFLLFQFNPCPKWKLLPNHLKKLFNHGKILQFFLANKSCWNIKNSSKNTKQRSPNWSLSSKGMTSYWRYNND